MRNILHLRTRFNDRRLISDWTPTICCGDLTAKDFRRLGPVVQSIIRITTTLRRQLVKYMLTTLSNAVVFLLKNVRIFCNEK